jgi:outer membrane lipoprotein-sorting protein
VIRILQRFAPVIALVFAFTLASAANAAEAKGKIKTVTADKHEFVVTDSDGKSWTFMHAKDGKILINDKESKLGDLQADDEVVITYEKDGEKMICSSVKATRK